MRPTLGRTVIVNDDGGEMPAIINAVHGAAGDSTHGEYWCISVCAFPAGHAPRLVTSIYLFDDKEKGVAYQQHTVYRNAVPAVAYWPERV